MIKRIFPALLAICLLPASGLADEEGYSGAQFLRLGGGARAAAVGDSGAASTGAQALFYNPAGLAATTGTELLFSHAKWVLDLGYSNLAAARRTAGGAYGLAISYLSVPATDKYDKTGNKLDDTYSASDMAVAFGYAHRAGASTDLGFSLKYIRSSLDDETAAAVAADLGIRYAAIQNKLSFGFALQNAGTKLKFIDEEARLPLLVKLGGEYKFNIARERGMNKDLIFFTDLNSLKDSGAYAGAGIEFVTTYHEGSAFALRCGYRTDIAGDMPGITAGLSVDMNAYGVEYAYAPMGDLGSTHRVSLTVKLGGPGVR